MKILAWCFVLSFLAGCGDGPGLTGQLDQCRAQKIWAAERAGGLSVSRVGSAYYLVGANSATSGWARVLSSGRPETAMPVPSGGATPLESTVMLAAGAGAQADDRLVTVSAGASTTDTRDRVFVAGVLKRGAQTFAPATPLLTAFYRGTLEHAFRASFDGHRAVFATGHVAVEDPLGVMIGPDGQVIGDQLGVSTTSMLFDIGIVPTLHGGVLHVLERGAGNNTWHAVELNDTGAIAMRADVDVGEEAHAVVAAEGPAGLVVAWLGADDQPRLARVNRTTGAISGPYRFPADVVAVLGLSAMGRGVAVLPRDASSRVGVLWLDDAGAVIASLPFTSIAPGVAWIPTEGKTLAFTETSTEGDVSLTEVICGPN